MKQVKLNETFSIKTEIVFKFLKDQVNTLVNFFKDPKNLFE